MYAKKILLIEDDPTLSDLLMRKLSLEGYAGYHSQDGRSGLAEAKHLKPDLILLDIIMEDIDGIEVLRQLKSTTQTKNIPVVMLTNVSAKEKMEEAKSLGAIDFWEKTKVMPQEILERCKRILGV
jgi:two-component system phosphate regulon response regulator PhoB